MSRPFAIALAQFMAATTARGMTKAATIAVATGLIAMLILTVDPAYEAAPRCIEAILWACVGFFIF
jgi:voltage-gated potassium channel